MVALSAPEFYAVGSWRRVSFQTGDRLFVTPWVAVLARCRCEVEGSSQSQSKTATCRTWRSTTALELILPVAGDSAGVTAEAGYDTQSAASGISRLIPTRAAPTVRGCLPQASLDRRNKRRSATWDRGGQISRPATTMFSASLCATRRWLDPNLSCRLGIRATRPSSGWRPRTTGPSRFQMP